jgi:hypothetical protein
LPSYEEAIQAHKKPYGTDHTEPPPAYEENTNTFLQSDNAQVVAYDESVINIPENSVYEELVSEQIPNMVTSHTGDTVRAEVDTVCPPCIGSSIIRDTTSNDNASSSATNTQL